MRMPPTIYIYTLLTILPVYHHRPRCTSEGVREAQAWVWQLGLPVQEQAQGRICFSIPLFGRRQARDERPTLGVGREAEPRRPGLNRDRICEGQRYLVRITLPDIDPGIKVRPSKLEL